ncbi:unnamed protein product, partial [Symbiodinium sp. KB8]
FKELKEKLEELSTAGAAHSLDAFRAAHYADLFNLATLVNFKAREGGSCIIAQDDTCEVALRRLAAWIHELRTEDRDAAQSTLAIKPSSFSTDVAPSWLVTEAASFHSGSGGGKAGAKGGKGKGKEKEGCKRQGFG